MDESHHSRSGNRKLKKYSPIRETEDENLNHSSGGKHQRDSEYSSSGKYDDSHSSKVNSSSRRLSGGSGHKLRKSRESAKKPQQQ